MNQRDQATLTSIAQLANCNPFSPRRFQLEKEILRRRFVAEDAVSWNRKNDQQPGDRANVMALTELAVEVVQRIQAAVLTQDFTLDKSLRQSYWDVVAYVLLYRHVTPTPNQVFECASSKDQQTVAKIWALFLADYRSLLDIGGKFSLRPSAAAHLFACLVQIHRTFFQVFDHILGDSVPVASLREKVWESVFSHDLARYHDGVFNQMRDLATLITGPSGTGKELVARAIGCSQYLPFELETESFKAETNHRFLPLNLSALSPTLIESELFGHHRGAFTGAVVDRIGWLEACSSHGAVFLDEIGELDVSLQVKLLRVLQQRTYCRLGETKSRRFLGKIISATNRNLEEEIHSRRFREDFYFRICSDRIETPSLREQLDDRPTDLYGLVLWIARKLSGEQKDTNGRQLSNQLADEATEWIEKNLGKHYAWTGNIRELEQCVSSFMLRREYIPLRQMASRNSLSTAAWAEPILRGAVTAEELLRRYCTHIYASTGSYEKTASVLGIDRRTVKAKLDSDLLQQLSERQ